MTEKHFITVSRHGKVGINEFVIRQAYDSQYTDYRGSWSDLANVTESQLEKGNFSQGYRDGVTLVHMDENECNLFYTYGDYPIFEGMKLEAKCEREKGREHEPPKIKVNILEPKNKCKFVDIVLYRKDVLAENNENSTDAEWEIVSINGRLKKEEAPMSPLTIVRNWLHLKGGTEMKGRTPEEVLNMLCDSVLYQNGMKRDANGN